MKTLLKKLACGSLFFLMIFVSLSCSRVSSEEPMNANVSVVSSDLELSFEADVNTTQYHSITFTNVGNTTKTITALAFEANSCFAFSVFAITDESGENILYQPTSTDENNTNTVQISLASSESVLIILQFSPTACDVHSYTTNFLIYYSDSGSTKSQNVILNAQVNDGTINIVCPEKPNITYNENIGDETVNRKLPALPTGSFYYLKIERIHGFLQPTGDGLEYLHTQIGTDYQLEFVRPEDVYTPVYLPFTTDDDGNVSLQKIDECSGLIIPTAVSDNNFWGAQVYITTPDVITGSIDRSTNIGRLSIPNINATLFSNINNSYSLVQGDDGNFLIHLNFSLTTGDSEPNEYLNTIAEAVGDDGEPFLDITADGANSVLNGLDIYHGTVRLVGVATFVASDDLNVSDSAESALIDNTAYLFLQFDGKIVTAEE